VADIELRDRRGGEAPGHDHDVRLQAREVEARAARQRADDAPGDVFDVGAALAKVVVLHLRVDEQHPVHHGLDGPLGLDPLGADDPLDVAQQLAIFEHQQVRLEEVGVPASELARHALFDLEDLVAGAGDGVAQAEDLLARVPGVDVGGHADGDVTVVEAEGAADGDARAHAEPVEPQVAIRSRGDLRRAHRLPPRSGVR
jgi:hypothetical protein